MVNVVSAEDVTRVLSRHVALYRRMTPTYQVVMLQSLCELWNPAHRRMLDVGGGTGVIAQAVKELFGVAVVSVDVEDRFLGSLDIVTQTFDGTALPFASDSFDCITLNNVLHHVPPPVRPRLLRECLRVVGTGPIYIKDHVAASRLDVWRLKALDVLGNTPFGGMITAQYLSSADWDRLAMEAGARIDARSTGQYRSGFYSVLFPNALEVTMRLMRRA